MLNINKEKLFKIYQILYFASLIVAIVLMILGRREIIDKNYADAFIFFILGVSWLVRGFIRYREKNAFWIVLVVLSAVAFVAAVNNINAM